MTSADQIAIISAAISLISMLFAIYYSHRASGSAAEANKQANEANRQAKVANDVAFGQAENDLRRDIAAAKIRYEDFCVDMEEVVKGKSPQELTEEDRKILNPKVKRMKSALEEYLNTYENACSKYLDKKIDVTRFKKSYFSEIRNLFEPPDNAFYKFLHPEGTSRYKALWIVYKEWYNLEKN